MSNRVGKFVDVELLVAGWLGFYLPTTRVVTVLPNPLPPAGVLWVMGVGGPSDFDQAKPHVDVQTLVPGVFGSASTLAGQAHAGMATLGEEQTVNGQAVHAVHCVTMPVRRHWSDGVDRFVATYRLDLPVLT